MKYIAFLRGINVGGNNKVSMVELKDVLTGVGLRDVRTYINSGNVLFQSDEKDSLQLTQLCEKAIEERFGFRVGCVVLAGNAYKQAIDSAPEWWAATDDKNIRNDALFVLRHGTEEAVMGAVGDVDESYERVAAGGNVVFWTVDRRKYSKARLPKIIGTDAYRMVSMRSSTTTKKLYDQLDD